MKRANWFFVLALAASATMSCGGSRESTPSNEATPPAESSAAESTPAAEPPAASAESIGVPECDDYLRRVETCINVQVPEDAKAMQRQSLQQLRDQWRQAAADANAKAGLATGCKAALDAARTSMAAYGCEL